MPYLTLNAPDNLQEPASKLSSGIPSEGVPTRSSSEATVAAIAAHDFAMIDYPLVKLDTEMITDATAARLTTSLLGHVLFLKNQVPLPVAQLARISSTKTNPQTLKQRQALLNSFDTISSHLETTFSALSTALARSRSHPDFPLAQAYLAFLVGSGIRTAKARVILGIDGLEKRIWGSRDDLLPSDVADADSDAGTEGDDSEGNDGSDEGAEGPDDSEEEDTDEEDSASTFGHSDTELSQHDFVDPIPHFSRAEEQKFLQNADRLLSRILANADANGKGMISELAPTQTHILLRAPRCFVHPAWIPCQNFSAALDGVLEEFLRGSGQREGSDIPIQRSSKVSKVEGVWITTRTGIQQTPRSASPLQEEKGSAGDEDDDLIWWSWDGKLLGIADW